MVAASRTLNGVFSETRHDSQEALNVRFALVHAEYLSERTQLAEEIASERGGDFEPCSESEVATRSAIDRVIRTSVYPRIEREGCSVHDVAAALNVAYGSIVNIEDKRSPQRVVALKWLKKTLEQFAPEYGAKHSPKSHGSVAVAVTNPNAIPFNTQLNQIRTEAGSLIEYIRAVRTMDKWIWDSISIGQALYGFSIKGQMQQSEAMEVAGFLQMVTEQMRGSPYELRPLAIHNCLCAISTVDAHLLNSDGRRVFGAFIDVVAEKIHSSPDSLSDQDIGQGMHRLRDIHIRSLDQAGREAYTRLLDALAEKIVQAREPLSARTIGSSLYALRIIEPSSFSSSGKEAIARLFEALASKVLDSSASLNAIDTGSAMYGLNNIELGQLSDSGRWAFGRLLRAIADKVASSNEPMNRQSIANCLYGLRNIDPQLLNREGHTGLCVIMEALSSKLELCTERFDPRAIADSLTGIRNISPAYLSDYSREAYEKLLGALARKITGAEGNLDNPFLARSLFGLKSVALGELRLSGTAAISDILASLAIRIPEYTYDLMPGETAHALFGLRDIEPSRLNRKGQEAYARILTQLVEQTFSNSNGLVISQSMRALSSMAAAGTHTFVPLTYARLVAEVSQNIEPQRLDTIGKMGILEDILAMKHLGAADLSEYAEPIFASLSVDGEDNPYIILGLIQTYSLYRKAIPEDLANRYRRLTLPDVADRLESEVVKRLVEEGLLSDAHSSHFYNGFEFDIASKSSRINIELDGRHHTSGFFRVRDALRDEFIKTFGWRVLRVKVRYGMSVDEITERVRVALSAASQPG